jgi:uncharacterized membrane protein
MKLIRAVRGPLIVWLFLEGVAAAGLVRCALEMPPRVASHFNFKGEADGWMNRTAHIESMAAVVSILPLLMIGIGLLMTTMPAASFNLPHRDYWLGPERRQETNVYLARYMTWFACAITAFFTTPIWLFVEFNRNNPAHLSNGFWFLLGGFLAFVVAWLVRLVTHFSRVPSDAG